MQAVGSRCDLHLYDGQGHGFFNQSRNAQHFYLTVFEMDRFLSSLGWLEGEPYVRVARLSDDTKCKVPVGEPGARVSTTVRPYVPYTWFLIIFWENGYMFLP